MSNRASHQATEPAATPQTPRAILDGWRARGADLVDPLRFRFIDALERRAAGHSGEARRVLDKKLAALLEAYAREVERGECADHEHHSPLRAGAATATTPAICEREPSQSALAQLVGELQGAARRPPPGQPAYPELPELDYFRETWARVRTDQQVRQSLQPAPGNAGPLNSSSLVHRSLSLMRELSPGYLKQFLSYVDALSWLEQVGGGAPASKDPPRAATAGKGARGKAR
ncbi:DUF2894 domain-containing protein [Paraburkholderia phenoliruptrix]|uniref:DUF2894 domain-containing protein n=2 Tax=Paraburkholderia phenoliruptrix TaxID=252970 RepID=K0DTK4_9BURK|nr:DUF2894 domain-containing protein [Paraburkholderia phenoliruptrix]AFT88205.1 hypothetical protein BUPH_00746 [Paraburkholderia phenoliruptrix BR3459a]MDR6418458.1 hypothetical protein [Paraburkholderia phenoliruptrix]CAB4047127.1 hypothetical protein LMG9964_00759 [Paraburkholderia phenoliruptrix]